MIGGHSDGAAVARKGLPLVAVCEQFRVLSGFKHCIGRSLRYPLLRHSSASAGAHISRRPSIVFQNQYFSTPSLEN